MSDRGPFGYQLGHPGGPVGEAIFDNRVASADARGRRGNQLLCRELDQPQLVPVVPCRSDTRGNLLQVLLQQFTDDTANRLSRLQKHIAVRSEFG